MIAWNAPEARKTVAGGKRGTSAATGKQASRTDAPAGAVERSPQVPRIKFDFILLAEAIGDIKRYTIETAHDAYPEPEVSCVVLSPTPAGVACPDR
jgi:hypothetical protein